MSKGSVFGYLGLFILVIAVVTALCTQALAEEILKIGGVGSALGSFRKAGEAFEKLNVGIDVEVLPSLGSAGAVRAVSEGAIGVGLMGRPMKDSERELGLIAFEAARTPFIFVTGSDVDYSDLTESDLLNIYRKDMEIWPGGKRIRIILRPAGDSDTLIAQAISPEISEAIDEALKWPGMLFPLTDQEAADVIEKTPGAFGFSTLTQVVSEKRSLMKVLSYNGVMPGPESLADGSYPYYKSIFIVTKPGPSESVGRFIAFIRSDEGKKLLEETGNLYVGDDG